MPEGYGRFVRLVCYVLMWQFSMTLFIAEGPRVKAIYDERFNDDAQPSFLVKFGARANAVEIVLLESSPLCAEAKKMIPADGCL